MELQFFLVLHHLTKKPDTVFPVPLLGGGAPRMSEKNRDGNLPLRGPVLRGKQIPD